MMKSTLLFGDALKLKRPAAFNVILKPAGPACNLNCTYCYYLEKKNLFDPVGNLKMSDGLLENFTKQFIEANEVPVVTFTWQGGEPTLIFSGKQLNTRRSMQAERGLRMHSRLTRQG
jgi:sulfatase maturation enzyme AslB (radical SAM superfamily)